MNAYFGVMGNNRIFEYDNNTVPDGISVPISVFQPIGTLNNDIISDTGVVVYDGPGYPGIFTDSDRIGVRRIGFFEVIGTQDDGPLDHGSSLDNAAYTDDGIGNLGAVNATAAANNGVFYRGIGDTHPGQHARMGINRVLGIVKFKGGRRGCHIHTDIKIGAHRTDIFPKSAEHVGEYLELFQSVWQYFLAEIYPVIVHGEQTFQGLGFKRVNAHGREIVLAVGEQAEIVENLSGRN